MIQQSMDCCEKGNTVGIVSAVVQPNGNIYPPQTGVLRGTVYPELDKPMACAAAPSGCVQPTAGQTMAFAAWDVRLFLDTHPGDPSALQLYQQLCQQAPKPNYACTFVPCGGKRWAWTDEPWPWECDANGWRG